MKSFIFASILIFSLVSAEGSLSTPVPSPYEPTPSGTSSSPYPTATPSFNGTATKFPTIADIKANRAKLNLYHNRLTIREIGANCLKNSQCKSKNCDLLVTNKFKTGGVCAKRTGA